MFLNVDELYSAISEYQLDRIATCEHNVRRAILAAIDEAKSYLNGKYDCEAIFNAEADRRHATLLEHCTNLAVWYIVRRANTDMIFEQVKEYRDAAIDWLEKVAGIKGTDKPLAPDLPVKKDPEGGVRIAARMGSNRKFKHDFDD